MIKTVIKRDGQEVKFDKIKIINAIQHSMKDIARNISDETIFKIAKEIENINYETISVESIQDAVEQKLKENNKNDVANEYHRYRNERTKIREMKSELMKTIEKIGVETDRDNANVGNNFSSKLLRIASESNKWHNLATMPKRLAKLHENGDLYFHDLDSYNLTTNCLHVPTGEILKRGFNTGYGTLNPPKRIETAGELSCILLQSTQNDMFGGQSHPNFDNDMADFIECTRQEIHKEISELLPKEEEKTIKEITEKKLEKRIRQAMQGVIYNLNTMHSRAGSQVPFSSVNIGLPKNKNSALVCKLFLEEYEKGLGRGEQPIFPNIIFRVKEGVNREKSDPYHYLYELACKVASKRMNPTFMNIDADFNKMYYDKGILPATMGCVDGKEIITYKYNNELFVESFERMWNRLSKKYNIKKQEIKDNYYMDLLNVNIYDTNKKDFVKCHRIIKNKDKGDWTRIKFSNGRSLLATADHPLPIIDKGRILVKDLKIGDKIIINSNQYNENSIAYDNEKAWLLGVILCDGCYDGNITTSLNAIGENDIIQNYKDIFTKLYELNIEEKKQNRGKKGLYKDLIAKGNQIHIKKELIKLFGGIQKINRQIPNEVFSWDKEAKLSFLAGMIDADGYVNATTHGGSVVQLGSVNKELSLQTMALAQSVGLPSKMYLNHYNSKDKNKIRYRIEFPTTIELMKYIVCNKKIEHFTKEPNKYFNSEAIVCSIEYLGNLDNYSYDVTTESDYFEVSGIYSHNCRTYLMSNINGKCGVEGRGNIAPTTINLPRLGILAKGDLDKFFELLDNRLELAKESLLHRYGVLKKLRIKDLPFVAGQGLMKGSENLSPDDSIEPILKQGSWAIGFIGLAETLVALTGKHHGEDEKSKELGYKIINHIRNYTDKTTQETKLNWSTYSTPAEGLSGKFIIQDKEKFGMIKGVTDKDYYTNSYHIPVGFSISIKDKIDIEAPFHKLCNGGHISYIELDDYPTSETVMDIIDYAYKNTNISYMGINFHIRYCRDCGTYLHGEDNCPKCNSKNIQGISRVTGYLSLDERFGTGKVAERKDRISHVTNKHVY